MAGGPGRGPGVRRRVGVVQTLKELAIELKGTADEIGSTIDKALADGTAIVWVTDTKGRRIGIPAERIAYIELDEDADNKRVGFGR